MSSDELPKELSSDELINLYKKMLTIAQIEILRMLLEHILKEKIRYATSLESTFKEQSRKVQEGRESLIIEEEILS